ncbi:MAG TPA: 30S ribosome-binding factor RbfA [Aquifex aeolicus]|uniref:Ribosome-binding factor A n=1 Tax=Aquifex aeolicus TaxID=63363 RepID=A0A9D1CEY4_AQUAO|nr:30S ribosome-binding factor RbfA [Aquificales bacterium]HIP98365.1 30S ribosome-binding factor RbfA [Aquifex aeolicus]HIQ26308.1 30S ribosome-binding factor RbfA [Aquifex aeolicus]
MGIRLERLSKAIQEEISSLLRDKLDPSEWGWISVTAVKLSKDLRDAVVFITVFPEGKEKRALERLNSLGGVIRKHLARRLDTKTVPKLKFEIDTLTKLVEKGKLNPPEM